MSGRRTVPWKSAFRASRALRAELELRISCAPFSASYWKRKYDAAMGREVDTKEYGSVNKTCKTCGWSDDQGATCCSPHAFDPTKQCGETVRLHWKPQSEPKHADRGSGS